MPLHYNILPLCWRAIYDTQHKCHCITTFYHYAEGLFMKLSILDTQHKYHSITTLYHYAEGRFMTLSIHDTQHKCHSITTFYHYAKGLFVTLLGWLLERERLALWLALARPRSVWEKTIQLTVDAESIWVEFLSGRTHAPLRRGVEDQPSGVNVIKRFFFVSKKARVFVLVDLFQPSLMFVGKERAYQSVAPCRLIKCLFVL